jgi:hypothetical protein
MRNVGLFLLCLETEVILAEIVLLGVIIVVFAFDLLELLGPVGLEGRFDIRGLSLASAHTLTDPVPDIFLILLDFLGVLLQPLIFLRISFPKRFILVGLR